uniref:Slc22a-10 n=1 Tax=Schmidtea mediterranea TaxID=79327 RepID=A0A0H3YK97_SCHMD|nr:slc22a-10 [Schmidtea mediterranea]
MDYDSIVKIFSRKKSFLILSLFFISFVCYVTTIHRHSISIALFRPRFQCKIPENLLSMRDSQNISAYISLNQCFYKQFTNETFKMCGKFKFDRSQIRETFITTNHAVCGRNFIGLIYSLLQIINIPLVVLFGFLSDKIGRKVSVVILLALHMSCQMTLGFVNEVWINVVLMSLKRLSVMTEIIGLIWIIEMNSCIHEPIIISLYFVFGTFSSFIVSLITITTMRSKLVFLISSGTMIIWVSILFIPESPRWLLIKNRHKKFYESIIAIAKLNKIDLPTNLVEDFIEYNEWIDVSKFSLKELWRYSKIKYRLLALCFVAFSINLFPPNFVIDISKLHDGNYGFAFLKAAVISSFFLAPLWIIKLWLKTYVMQVIILLITTALFYSICLFFNPQVISHLVLQYIFKFIAQNLLKTIMILLFSFVINLMPTTHRGFASSLLVVSAIFGNYFSNLVRMITVKFRGMMRDDIYIIIVTYFLLNIISYICFYHQVPEIKCIPYPQISSDAAIIEKGSEDELQREYEEKLFNFNKKYEFTHLFQK